MSTTQQGPETPKTEAVQHSASIKNEQSKKQVGRSSQASSQQDEPPVLQPLLSSLSMAQTLKKRGKHSPNMVPSFPTRQSVQPQSKPPDHQRTHAQAPTQQISLNTPVNMLKSPENKQVIRAASPAVFSNIPPAKSSFWNQNLKQQPVGGGDRNQHLQNPQQQKPTVGSTDASTKNLVKQAATSLPSTSPIRPQVRMAGPSQARHLTPGQTQEANLIASNQDQRPGSTICTAMKSPAPRKADPFPQDFRKTPPQHFLQQELSGPRHQLPLQQEQSMGPHQGMPYPAFDEEEFDYDEDYDDDYDEDMEGLDEEEMGYSGFQHGHRFNYPSSDSEELSEEESALLEELRCCDDDVRYQKIVARLEEKGVDPEEIEELLSHTTYSQGMFADDDYYDDDEYGGENDNEAESLVSSSSQGQMLPSRNQPTHSVTHPAQQRGYTQPKCVNIASGLNQKPAYSTSVHSQQGATSRVPYGATHQRDSRGLSTQSAISKLPPGQRTPQEQVPHIPPHHNQQMKAYQQGHPNQQRKIFLGSHSQVNPGKSQADSRPGQAHQELTEKKAEKELSFQALSQTRQAPKQNQMNRTAESQDQSCEYKTTVKSADSGCSDPGSDVKSTTAINLPGQMDHQPNPAKQLSDTSSQQSGSSLTPSNRQSPACTSQIQPSSTRINSLKPSSYLEQKYELQAGKASTPQLGQVEDAIKLRGSVNQNRQGVRKGRIYSPSRTSLQGNTAPCEASIARLNVELMQQNLDKEIMAKKKIKSTQQQQKAKHKFVSPPPPSQGVVSQSSSPQKPHTQSAPVYQPKHQLPPRQSITAAAAAAIMTPNLNTKQTSSDGRPICSVVPFTSNSQAQTVSTNIQRLNTSQQSEPLRSQNPPLSSATQDTAGSFQNLPGTAQNRTNLVSQNSLSASAPHSSTSSNLQSSASPSLPSCSALSSLANSSTASSAFTSSALTSTPRNSAPSLPSSLAVPSILTSLAPPSTPRSSALPSLPRSSTSSPVLTSTASISTPHSLAQSQISSSQLASALPCLAQLPTPRNSAPSLPSSSTSSPALTSLAPVSTPRSLASSQANSSPSASVPTNSPQLPTPRSSAPSSTTTASKPPPQRNMQPQTSQHSSSDQNQPAQSQISTSRHEAISLDQVSQDKCIITGKGKQQGLMVDMVYQIRSPVDGSLVLALWNGKKFEDLQQAGVKGSVASRVAQSSQKPQLEAQKGISGQNTLADCPNPQSQTATSHDTSSELGHSADASQKPPGQAPAPNQSTYVKPFTQDQAEQRKEQLTDESNNDSFVFKEPISESKDQIRMCPFCGYASKDFKRCDSCRLLFRSTVNTRVVNNKPQRSTFTVKDGMPDFEDEECDHEEDSAEDMDELGHLMNIAATPCGSVRGQDVHGRAMRGGLKQVMGVMRMRGKSLEDFESEDNFLDDGGRSTESCNESGKRAIVNMMCDMPRKRSKRALEPVTVTISSDEDEPSSTSNNFMGVAPGLTRHANSEPSMFPPKEAEPLRQFGRSRQEHLEDKGMDPKMMRDIQQSAPMPYMDEFDEDEDDEDDDIDDPPVYEIDIRSVRIGSMRTQPEGPLLINTQGVCFKVRSERTEEDFECEILAQEVVHVKYFSGQIQPVLFLFLTEECGEKLRKLCHMEAGDEEYFDPNSKDMKQKMVVIIIECFNMSQGMLRETLSLWADVNKVDEEVFIDELTEETSNDLLIQSAPPVLAMDVGDQDMVHFRQRQMGEPNRPAFIPRAPNSPPSDNEPDSTSSSPPQSRYHHYGPSVRLLQYPPPPARRLSITTEDLYCLTEGEFLNDVIIDFYLQYLYHEKLSEENRRRTHIFSSFFYKRLTQRDRHSEDAKKSLPERRHARVKKWTKTVDLFSKDFIIIPINEHSHWYLAVICFPGLPEAEVVPYVPSVAHAEDVDDDLNENTGGEEGANEETPSNDSVFKTIFGKQLDAKQCMDIEESKYTMGTKQPCILMFDSLAGPSRAPNIRMLRDYLQCEWNAKKSEARDITKILRGSTPRAPQQSNFSDCGVFLLQYVESFFEDPIADFQIPMKGLQHWFAEEVVYNKRREIHELIMSLHRVYQMERGDPNILDLRFESSPRELPVRFHQNMETGYREGFGPGFSQEEGFGAGFGQGDGQEGGFGPGFDQGDGQEGGFGPEYGQEEGFDSGFSQGDRQEEGFGQGFSQSDECSNSSVSGEVSRMELASHGQAVTDENSSLDADYQDSPAESMDGGH